MRTRILSTVFALSTFTLLSENVEAQSRSSKNQKGKIERNVNHKGHSYRTKPIGRKPYYRYPRHRRYVRTLPYGHRRFYFGGLQYYFHAGIYYTSYGDSYVVVLPPPGFRIAVLPVGYVRVMVGPSIYYYHSGIYYTEIESRNDQENYEVAEPPVGGIIEALPEEAEKVEIDGKVLYDHNGTLYKEIQQKGGKIGYEIVYVSTETKA